MPLADASGAHETSNRAFIAVAALLFGASAAVTIMACASMSAMGEMPMPGGWALSMAWSRMCGQTWARAAGAFLGMWIAMMMAMMLPSLAPVLWRYRQGFSGAGATHPGGLTGLVGGGYFFVWAVLGIVVYGLGVALAALEMRVPVLARAVPVVVGMVVTGAGVFQFTACKARYLGCCRQAPGWDRVRLADAGMAWRTGLRIGLHCGYCCAGLTTILLAVGVMDLSVMELVALGVTAERVARDAVRAARVVGVVAVGLGLILVGRAIGIG